MRTKSSTSGLRGRGEDGAEGQSKATHATCPYSNDGATRRVWILFLLVWMHEDTKPRPQATPSFSMLHVLACNLIEKLGVALL